MKKITFQNKTVSFTNNDYFGSGGEGQIFVKSGLAFKIYHEKKKVISENKINELSVLSQNNKILAPIDCIYPANGKSHIGFAMKYVDKTEFLCKLFTKSFRSKNNITPEIIKHLVSDMHDTLNFIHKLSILVVDYNEMNFLVSSNYDKVYYIDVDSYQTPSYPATALMESVRDRKVKNNKFDTGSDWFSAAVVSFLLYTGCHPYKGRHPDYKPKDWQIMMDKNISIFDSKCKLPPNCQDLSIIPRAHLQWFKDIFQGNERKAAPKADAIPALTSSVNVRVINSNESFEVTSYYDYKGRIGKVQFINGIIYAFTSQGVYVNEKKLFDYQQKGIKGFVSVSGSSPVYYFFDKRTKRFTLFKKQSSGETDVLAKFEADDFFVDKNKLYVINKNTLSRKSVSKFGEKFVVSSEYINTISLARTVFSGGLIQDILGVHYVGISNNGDYIQYKLPELSGYRIVVAKYVNPILIVVGEKTGKYTQFIFDGTTCRKKEDVSLNDINFTVLDNGVAVLEDKDNDSIEIFKDNQNVKVVNGSPLNDDSQLISIKNAVFIIQDNRLMKMKVKK